MKIEIEAQLSLAVNGRRVEIKSEPITRLSKVLREELGLTGTKVGCDAGDCGACTVLINGKPACACLVAVGQLEGAEVTTVEGLAQSSVAFDRLQKSFLQHGAAQCGICTPGMLVSAVPLIEKNPRPSEAQVQDALGGVLCRCTGYRKIISAVMDAGTEVDCGMEVKSDGPVGQRLARLDGARKVLGQEIFGADQWPADALALRVIRSPYHRAAFRLGDLDAFVAAHPGIQAVFTSKDIPGKNCFGVHPRFADQPVFAEKEARFRGEAVAAVVGDPDAVARFDPAEFPIEWEELPALTSVDAALAANAPKVHARATGQCSCARACRTRRRGQSTC